MNTRLQVEHTVTEAVTGLDLVEWQLRVASGEPLPLSQEEIRLNGHAIEARVCAEDPDRDFLPSAGNLRLLQWPSDESIRVDAGFATGDAVPDTYDSLLGKVVAWAPDRSQAAACLARALEQTYCVGVQTNEKWLSRVLSSPRFLEVRHSIAFLQEASADFAGPSDIEAPLLALAALALHAAGPASSPTAREPRVNDLHAQRAAFSPVPLSERPVSPWDLLDGFTPNLAARVDFTLSWHGHEHAVTINFTRGPSPLGIASPPLGSLTVRSEAPWASLPTEATVDKVATLSIADLAISDSDIAARLDQTRRRARYCLDGTHIHLWSGGLHFDIALDDPRLKVFSATAVQGGLTTPLPGVVVAVSTKVGESVKAGDILMVIEAMKMEHSIRAPQDGVVKVIHYRHGDRVPEGSQLLELA